MIFLGVVFGQQITPENKHLVAKNMANVSVLYFQLLQIPKNRSYPKRVLILNVIKKGLIHAVNYALMLLKQPKIKHPLLYVML